MNVFVMALCSDAAALLILVVLLVLSKKNDGIKDREGRFFRRMLRIMVCMCVFELLLYGIESRTIPGNNQLAGVMMTLYEITGTLMIFAWLSYVNFRLYHNRDHLKRTKGRYLLPMLAMLCLDVINVFTGIFFSFEGDIAFQITPLYYVFEGIKTASFYGAFFMLFYHKKHFPDRKIFSVWPVLIPMLIGSVISTFTVYPGLCLGLSLGLLILFGMLMNEGRCVDPETGFFVPLYLEQVKEKIKSGGYDPESAILISVAGSVKESAPLISEQLPEDSETIRMGEKELLVLSTVQKRGPLFMVQEDVEAVLSEAGIPCEIRLLLRKKEEDPVAFLERVSCI